MTKFITKTVEIVFLLLMGLIVLVQGVAISNTVLDGWLGFLCGTVFVLLLIAFLYLARNKIKSICMCLYDILSDFKVWQLALALGLFCAVTKIVFVFVFNNNADFHPDMAMYRSYASQFAESGYITENAPYARKFSYTMIYGLVMSPFAKLFGNDTKVFTTALSLMHSVAMVLIFDIVRKYTGKEIAFFCILLYNLLPMGLFQTQLFTHENALLFFHIVGFYIFLKAFEKKYNIAIQLLFIVLSAIFISVGKSINAAGRVLFISFGIYAVAKLFEKGVNLKQILKVGCVSLILITMYTGSAKLCNYIKETYVSSVGASESYAIPYGWGLYLGFNYEEQGRWNDKDRDTWEMHNEFDSKEASQEYQIDLIKGRFEEYRNNPLKLPVHLFNKIKILWGTQTLPFAYEMGNSANDFVLRGFGGIIHKGIDMINLLSFALLYMIIFLTKLSSIKKKNISVTPVMHFEMFVIGVTLPLLLFEVTPKYASHLHLLMFAILAFSIKEYFTTSLVYRNKCQIKTSGLAQN